MTLECAHAAKLTVPIRECSDHMSAKLARLITRIGWSHPSGSARWNATTAPKHSSTLRLVITTSSLSTEYVQSTEGHQHMGDVHWQERIGTVRALWQMFDSGLPVALLVHDPLHSTLVLHVGISLLRRIQPEQRLQ
jgi:hypothetical protein